LLGFFFIFLLGQFLLFISSLLSPNEEGDEKDYDETLQHENSIELSSNIIIFIKLTPSDPPTAPPMAVPSLLLGVCEVGSLSLAVVEFGPSAAVSFCDVSIKLTFLGSVTLTASTVLKVFAKLLSS